MSALARFPLLPRGSATRFLLSLVQTDHEHTVGPGRVAGSGRRAAGVRGRAAPQPVLDGLREHGVFAFTTGRKSPVLLRGNGLGDVGARAGAVEGSGLR